MAAMYTVSMSGVIKWIVLKVGVIMDLLILTFQDPQSTYGLRVGDVKKNFG